MENFYNVSALAPCFEKEGMLVQQEKLARRVVERGLLRISADHRSNFAHFRIIQTGFYQAFSEVELYDDVLLERTRGIIREALKKDRSLNMAQPLEDHVDEKVGWLRVELQKSMNVEPEKQMSLARLLVQSTHPIVMELVLLEEVELFLSYAHTVSDLLSIRDWQSSSRDSSGLQKTSVEDASVFVSAGGDPFVPDEQRHDPYDGSAATYRLMVIAAQELGHFADIIRNKEGEYIGRHSAEYGMKAKERVRQARLKDVAHMKAVDQQIDSAHLQSLVDAEVPMVRAYADGKKHKELLSGVLYSADKSRFIRSHKKLSYVAGFPVELHSSPFLGTNLSQSLSDMQFNLHPANSAYYRDDKQEEEAIMCMEALARVPQQAQKWGHRLTKLAWPHLYAIYYNEVIPACVQAYQARTGKPFRLSPQRYKTGMFKKMFG